jgi:CRP-like cAMP-binding protein
MTKYIISLIKIELFSGLTEKEIINSFLRINFIEKKFTKDSAVLIQGNKYESLYIILSGDCYGEILDYSGKVVKVEDLQSPCLLAPAVLFAKNNSLPVSIIAKTEIQCLIIEKNNFLKLCLSNERILKNYLELISDKFTFISKKLSFLAFKTIKEKLANYLMSLPQNEDGSVELTSSMEELSDFFGVSRPSLSRVFVELVDNKIIEKNNKTIKIIDQNRLVL